MKTPAQVLATIERRLTSSWHREVIAFTDTWPLRVALSAPTSSAAGSDRARVRQWAFDWHDWAAAHPAELTVATRRINGLTETLPSHITIADFDTAAHLVGREWPGRVARARRRLPTITESFPAADASRALQLADPLSDVDFDLAVAAAAWFTRNPLVWPGLTARQVPVPGLHGKWLNTHRPLLQALSGIDDLRLAERPTRIHFTYADPAHLAGQGRHHDSQTLGDTVALPYQPSTLLICENKDTVVMFPPHDGLVVVEGGGAAGSALLPQIPWIASHPDVVYWGDIDADGLAILNALRAAGIQARSILMDVHTYEAYERYGSWTGPNGVPLGCRPRRPTPHLTGSEQRLYDMITDPAWSRTRRIEQERIPLDVAVEHLARGAV